MHKHLKPGESFKSSFAIGLYFSFAEEDPSSAKECTSKRVVDRPTQLMCISDIYLSTDIEGQSSSGEFPKI